MNPIYRSIFQKNTHALVVADILGNHIDYNTAYLQLFELSEEVNKMTVLEVLENYGAEYLFLRQLQENEHFQGITQNILIRKYSIYGVARVYSVYEFHNDKNYIFAKQEIEMKKPSILSNLYKSEQISKLIIENSSEVITLSSAKGRVEYVTPSIEKILGYVPTQWYGKNILDFFHPDDLEKVNWQDENGINKKELRLNHRFLLANGTYEWFSTIMKYIFDKEKKLTSLQTSSRNVQHRINTEMALQETKAKLEAVLHSTPATICIFDRNFTILAHNQEGSDENTTFLNHDLQENENLLHALKNNYREDFQHYARRAFQGQSVDFEQNIHQNTEMPAYWYFFNLRPICNEKKFVVQVCMTAFSIDSRKKMQFVEQNKQIAEKSLQFKNEFLANISHEIRTPMNGLIGITHLLNRTKLDTEQQKFVKIIEKSAENLLAILNDMLDLVKIESGNMPLKRQEIRVRELLEKIIALFEPNIAEKNLQLSMEIDADVPENILADEIRLSQVLNNFMSNAIKFTKKGGIKIHVGISENMPLVLKFRVSDTGVGIDEKDLGHIFEKFFQADQDDYLKAQGTGLGLAICKNLVSAWHGKIGVESRWGEGSCFWFTLPTQKIEKVQIQSKLRNYWENIRFEDLKVLLAEDNEVNQNVLKLMLEEAECQVRVVSNGLEALQAVHQQNFDVILMDIQMPIMNGLEASSEIRKYFGNTSGCPILIGVSANTMEKTSESYILAGLDDYLEKPIYSKNLIEKLAKWKPLKVKRKKKDIIKEEIIQKSNYIQFHQEVIEKITKLAKNNPQFLQSLFNSFIDDTRNLGKNLEKSLKNKDYTSFAKDLHTLKGLTGTIGAKNLHQCSANIYEYCKNYPNTQPSETDCTQLFILLEQSIREAQEIIKSF